MWLGWLIVFSYKIIPYRNCHSYLKFHMERVQIYNPGEIKLCFSAKKVLETNTFLEYVSPVFITLFALLSFLQFLSLIVRDANKIFNQAFLINSVKYVGPKALHHMTVEDRWAFFNIPHRLSN